VSDDDKAYHVKEPGELGELLRKLTLTVRDVEKMLDRAGKLAASADQEIMTAFSLRGCENPRPFFTHYGTVLCAGCWFSPHATGETVFDRQRNAMEFVRTPHWKPETGPVCGCEVCRENRQAALDKA
jgi:hypothetical protein